MQKSIRIAAQWSLLLVFLVILAGSVVRMTGSGMGCPDWPKCFGYLVPPTDEEQLIWKGDHEYFKGQMIIVNEALLVATTDFSSSSEFNPEYWRTYDKHDYATFNPTHTWIEYINRLLGALSGIPVLLLFVLSILNVRHDGVTFVMSGLSIAILGFVAWLGKLVVDGNLIPHSITYHMFGALALVLLLVAILYRNRFQGQSLVHPRGSLHLMAQVALIMTAIQIYLGTGVREQIDVIAKSFDRSGWIDQLGNLFLIHRSFSIALVLVNGWLILKLMKLGWPSRLPVILAVLISIEIFAGVLLNYAGFPAFVQPIHLLAAMGIAAIQFYLLQQLWPLSEKLRAS